MDTKDWIFIALGILEVLVLYQQNNILRGQSPPLISDSGIDARTAPWLRVHWPLLIMALLFAGSWVPYFLMRNLPVVQPEPVPALIAKTTMGVNKDVADRYISITATVEGTATAAKYGEKNSIFVFCLVGDSKIDPGLDTAIDRSKPFDLAQRPVDIEVPLGSENTKRILKSGAIDIYLLMIPKDVDQAALFTFDDIYQHGGKQLAHTAMGGSTEDLSRALNAK